MSGVTESREDSVEAARLLPLRRTAAMLRPVGPHLITCGVLSAAGAAAGLAPYIAFSEIARAIAANPANAGDARLVWTWVAVGIAGAAARLVLVYLSSFLGHYADAALLHDLRERILARLGVLPLGWFRSVGSGQVRKVLVKDLEEMHELIAHALGGLTGAVTALLVGFGYLLWVDWRLALVTASIPLLMGVCYRVAMRSMPAHMARLNAAEARVSTATVEYADGIEVVKAFGGRGLPLERFADAVQEQSDAMRVWVAETRYSTALSRVFGSEMTLLAVMLVAGLGLASAGLVTMPDLLAFLIVGIGLPTSILPAVLASQGLRSSRLAAGHIDGLLSRRALPEPDRPSEPSGYRIELDRVSFSYDGRTEVVHEVSAVCEPGTVTALVGPSGAGKSTLANLLPRFHDVTGGAIRMGGVDIREMSPRALLSSLSLVFQDVVLLRDTVTENIRLTRPDASLQQVQQAAKAAQVHHVIEQLPDGYDTLLGSGTAGLSGGERQRLSIARAILSEAPIVVLDEATAALDPDSEAAVQDALAELVAGKTVIVIAHRLHTITNADQILVLDRGVLAQVGTHDELLTEGGLYARMWAAQHGGSAS